MSYGKYKKSNVSKSDDWTIRSKLKKAIELEYGHIVLDVAADKKNTQAKRFFTKKDDALTKDWNKAVPSKVEGIIYGNPPYSKPNKPNFTKKAFVTARDGKRFVVLVLPSNTRDVWFHDLVLRRLADTTAYGSSVRHNMLGGLWPALSICNEVLTVWFLQGSVQFDSPHNPDGNGAPGGVVVVAFHPRGKEYRES